MEDDLEAAIQKREVAARKREARRLRSVEKIRKTLPPQDRLLIPPLQNLSPFYPKGQRCPLDLDGIGMLSGQIRRFVAKDRLTRQDKQVARDKGWIHY